MGIIPIFFLEFILTGVAESTVISTRLKNASAQVSMLAAYFSQEINANDNSDELAAEAIDDASDYLSQEIDANDSSGKLTEEIIDDVSGLFLNRIQVVNRDFKIISDTYQINKGKICISKYVNNCFNGQGTAFVDKKNQCLIITQPVRDRNSNVNYVVFVVTSISDIYSAMDSIRLIGISIIVILLVIVLFFAVFLSYMTAKPFKNINATIAKIDRGHMTEEIKLSGCSEVETISGSFNKMLDRINQLEDSRQMFVSNVSHELKTPMTSMKVLCDSLLQMDNVPNEMYREFMSDLSTEINRENVIISDLLTLVKLDNANVPINISQVNINGLLESILKMVKPLAEQKHIDLVLESYRPIVAEVDEVKMSMAISNLVENGIKYNNPEGFVHVSLNADRTYFYVKVQDNGKGIPADSLSRVFDRFYRVDKARDRATGGSGLGLSITKSIVLAHNGDIKVYSEEGKGTTFTMQIPLTHFAGSDFNEKALQ